MATSTRNHAAGIGQCHRCDAAAHASAWGAGARTAHALDVLASSGAESQPYRFMGNATAVAITR
eukprot:3811015-Pleurochrysis_carterae.AAC.4